MVQWACPIVRHSHWKNGWVAHFLDDGGATGRNQSPLDPAVFGVWILGGPGSSTFSARFGSIGQHHKQMLSPLFGVDNFGWGSIQVVGIITRWRERAWCPTTVSNNYLKMMSELKTHGTWGSESKFFLPGRAKLVGPLTPQELGPLGLYCF